MFNWVTVIVLLPLEIATSKLKIFCFDHFVFLLIELGVLFHLTEAITRNISLDRKASSNPQFLNVLTRPLTHRIIQVTSISPLSSFAFVFSLQLDEKVIQNIALGSIDSDVSLVKHFCSYENMINENGTSMLIPGKHCGFIFATVTWPDWGIGLLLLICSIVSLCTCLVLLVKLLQSMLKGTISTVIHKTVNADFPGIFHHLTPYLAIGVIEFELFSLYKFKRNRMVCLGWLHIYNTRSK